MQCHAVKRFCKTVLLDPINILNSTIIKIKQSEFMEVLSIPGKNFRSDLKKVTIAGC
jgi:hypothetical protein